MGVHDWDGQVRFHKLSAPKEEAGVTLELSKQNTYLQIVTALAKALGGPEGADPALGMAFANRFFDIYLLPQICVLIENE